MEQQPNPVQFQHVPADGWYFVQPVAREGDAAVMHRVAVWRIGADGVGVGLIAVSANDGTPPRLVEPPQRVNGRYVHVSDMSPSESGSLLHWRRQRR